MPGERKVENLLTQMSPELMDGEYVFCTFAASEYGDYLDLEPIVAISESEGLTLIIPQHKADERSYSYESGFRRITLRIHSSLEAVGLTTAFSSKLAEQGVSANVVAGYYHDHIFVQSQFAEKAMKALTEISH